MLELSEYTGGENIDKLCDYYKQLYDTLSLKFENIDLSDCNYNLADMILHKKTDTTKTGKAAKNSTTQNDHYSRKYITKSKTVTNTGYSAAGEELSTESYQTAYCFGSDNGIYVYLKGNVQAEVELVSEIICDAVWYNWQLLLENGTEEDIATFRSAMVEKGYIDDATQLDDETTFREKFKRSKYSELCDDETSKAHLTDDFIQWNIPDFYISYLNTYPVTYAVKFTRGPGRQYDWYDFTATTHGIEADRAIELPLNSGTFDEYGKTIDLIQKSNDKRVDKITVYFKHFYKDTDKNCYYAPKEGTIFVRSEAGYTSLEETLYNTSNQYYLRDYFANPQNTVPTLMFNFSGANTQSIMSSQNCLKYGIYNTSDITWYHRDVDDDGKYWVYEDQVPDYFSGFIYDSTSLGTGADGEWGVHGSDARMAICQFSFAAFGWVDSDSFRYDLLEPVDRMKWDWICCKNAWSTYYGSTEEGPAYYLIYYCLTATESADYGGAIYIDPDDDRTKDISKSDRFDEICTAFSKEKGWQTTSGEGVIVVHYLLYDEYSTEQKITFLNEYTANNYTQDEAVERFLAGGKYYTDEEVKKEKDKEEFKELLQNTYEEFNNLSNEVI